MVHQEDSALFLSHVKIRTMIVLTISANVILGIMIVMEYALKMVMLEDTVMAIFSVKIQIPSVQTIFVSV